MTASASATERAIGFSTTTCLPAPRAASACAGVEPGGRADRDGVDVVAIEEVRPGRWTRARPDARRRRAPARPTRSTTAASAMPLDRLDRLEVLGRDRAAADQPDADGRRRPLMRGPRRPSRRPRTTSSRSSWLPIRIGIENMRISSASARSAFGQAPGLGAAEARDLVADRLVAVERARSRAKTGMPSARRASANSSLGRPPSAAPSQRQWYVYQLWAVTPVGDPERDDARGSRTAAATRYAAALGPMGLLGREAAHLLEQHGRLELGHAQVPAEADVLVPLPAAASTDVPVRPEQLVELVGSLVTIIPPSPALIGLDDWKLNVPTSPIAPDRASRATPRRGPGRRPRPPAGRGARGGHHPVHVGRRPAVVDRDDRLRPRT